MDNKSYYAIIPANVRYDENLRDKAKLLYGEITALCNEKGYCWASNGYFAELYKVKKETISRLIKNLSDSGYIRTELQYQDKEIVGRKIYLGSIPFDENDNTYCSKSHDPIDEKVKTPIDEKVKENNTLYNNTFNNTKEYKEDKSSTHSKRFKKPSVEEIHEYYLEKGYQMDSEAFYDYYESNGWIVGRHKMKDWKAAVRNWVRRSNEFKNGCNNRGIRFSTAEKLDNDYNMMEAWANNE